MRLIQGVRAIADRYDLFLVDLWGVMHDGVTCYPAALDCLAQLKAMGKKVVLLSNAPRRSDDVRTRSAALGLAPSYYDAIYSSGEMTWRYLQQAPLGRRAYPIMTEKDQSLLEGAPITLCDSLQDADFILCSGPSEEKEHVADWDQSLKMAQERGLIMLCANPDLVVHRGGHEEICAGALAQHYEHLGGKVLYQGKPHPDIYRWVLAEQKVAPEKTLAFGDSLRTDVKGAASSHCASLFVAGGIHARQLLPDFSHERLEKIAAPYGLQPDFALDYLRW